MDMAVVLPAPFRANDPVEGTRRDGEVDAVDGNFFSELFAQRPNDHRVVGSRRSVF